jgi:restriction endonuclease Mrr
MDAAYHYPPDLLQLLIDTIPRLCRSKRDVLLFFRGAGVGDHFLGRLEQTLSSDPSSINKFEIVRTVLREINEKGDPLLRARREVLKRVVEFEDFSTCWPQDQLQAKGLVAEVRRVTNVKDSFTRMNIERETESAKHRRAADLRSQEQEVKKQARESVKADFYRLFGESNPHQRGRLLESVLNRLFDGDGLMVRESFTLRSDTTSVPLEQIDGIIELDGHIYLVEMKWLSATTSRGDVSEHLVRVYSREGARGIFISATDYSAGALDVCKDALTQRVVVLATLQELVWVLENEKGLSAFLRAKVRGTVASKQPFVSVEGEL